MYSPTEREKKLLFESPCPNNISYTSAWLKSVTEALTAVILERTSLHISEDKVDNISICSRQLESTPTPTSPKDVLKIPLLGLPNRDYQGSPRDNMDLPRTNSGYPQAYCWVPPPCVHMSYGHPRADTWVCPDLYGGVPRIQASEAWASPVQHGRPQIWLGAPTAGMIYMHHTGAPDDGGVGTPT
ncbi:hypothetical protein DFH06DRAFT_1130450 [Mycena polygramma]|nr:hypothetical protein DFH06DRAFT_1130450 [Mycena polygramma]